MPSNMARASLSVAEKCPSLGVSLCLHKQLWHHTHWVVVGLIHRHWDHHRERKVTDNLEMTKRGQLLKSFWQSSLHSNTWAFCVKLCKGDAILAKSCTKRR